MFQKAAASWIVHRIYLEETKGERERRCQRELAGGEGRIRKVRGEWLVENELGSQAPCCQRAEKPLAVLAFE